MTTITEYAKIIESQLNENAHARAFHLTFKVWADIGDFQEAFKNQTEKTLINCVLRETTGVYTPIKEAKTKFINLAFEIAVNQAKVDEAKVVLQDWSTAQLGVIWQANDFTYMITPGAITTGTAFNTCDVGSTLPLTITIELQETELGLISNEMAWSIATGELQAANVEVLNGQIISQRTQQSQNYMNASETVSINQLTTLTIQLLIPVAKNDICKAIMDSILSNSKDDTYTISMVDEWSAGISGDFILSSGELRFESGKVVAMNCTFLKKDQRLGNNM